MNESDRFSLGSIKWCHWWLVRGDVTGQRHKRKNLDIWMSLEAAFNYMTVRTMSSLLDMTHDTSQVHTHTHWWQALHKIYTINEIRWEGERTCNRVTAGVRQKYRFLTLSLNRRNLIYKVVCVCVRVCNFKGIIRMFSNSIALKATTVKSPHENSDIAQHCSYHKWISSCMITNRM